MSTKKLSGPPTGPHAAEDLGHGYSVAMWAAVGVAFVGFLVGTIAVMMLNWPLLYISFGILALSLVVGRVLSMMGFGSYTNEAIDAPAGKDGETLGVK